MTPLFDPYALGSLQLRNRVVTAPMTRGRALRRLRHGLPLGASSPETYYQGGAQGYVDYPAAP